MLKNTFLEKAMKALSETFKSTVKYQFSKKSGSKIVHRGDLKVP